MDNYSYERGDVTSEQYAAIVSRAGQVSEWDLVIDDVSQSFQQIVAVTRQEHAKKPLDLVVVDSLGLLTGSAAANRNLQIGEYTRRLKLLSREIGAPILSPHHVSDKAIDSRGDKRPRASDAYESGHVHQDVDGLLGLYRDELHNPETEMPHIMEVLVLKDRLGGGTAGRIELFFTKFGTLHDAARRVVRGPMPEPPPESWTDDY